ncbi:hypothetical protein EDD85DRAFT_794002 [Armillaria nabsnona]|nr:hypothetical protein EDD85DRAFT_794002 [Armillaria nabsnona]
MKWFVKFTSFLFCLLTGMASASNLYTLKYSKESLFIIIFRGSHLITVTGTLQAPMAAALAQQPGYNQACCSLQVPNCYPVWMAISVNHGHIPFWQIFSSRKIKYIVLKKAPQHCRAQGGVDGMGGNEDSFVSELEALLIQMSGRSVGGGIWLVASAKGGGARIDDGSMAMMMSEGEMDLTTELPNVKNRGGEGVVLVARP